MKKFKEVKVHAHIERSYSSTVCDLCGDESEDNWAPGYSANKTEVKIIEGKSYPEGGSGTEISYDICPTCFKTKLIPWLESQGAHTIEYDWSW